MGRIALEVLLEVFLQQTYGLDIEMLLGIDLEGLKGEDIGSIGNS